MLVFIGTIGPNNTNFNDRSQAAFSEYDIKDINHMPIENGSIYYGCKGTAGPGDDTINSLGSQGLIAGKILNSNDYKPVQFDRETINALVSNPQLCTTQFWGRYSGCLYNQRTKTHTLLRDPLGLSTLFYRVDNGTVIFSNHLRTLYQALEQKPSLNMHYFAEHAIHENNSPRETPFEGICELQAGMSLRIDASGNIQHELLWDLSKYQKNMSTNLIQHEQELYEIIRHSLKGWFANSTGICLELSGGLDSSALMIFLRDVFKDEKNIIGINFFDSKTPSSNEIEHAQEIATSCSSSLKFCDWQKSSLLDQLPHGWYPNRPSTFLFSFSDAQSLSDIASSNHCSDIINGQGGDHVFMAPHPNKALADYWINKGMWSSKNILSESSAINRAPWWALTKDALHDVGSYYAPKYITPRCAFKRPDNATAHLSTHYVDSIQDKPFYLNRYLKNHLPGKADHIKALSHAVAFADRNQRIPKYTFSHPLLFQPIVEHALKLPTYQSFAKGHDRIAIRNIANKITPARALWRNVKGETTGTMCKKIAQNASKIEEIILEGHLTNHGLINKQWLETEITKVRHGASANMWPLLHLLSEQIWINQWGL